MSEYGIAELRGRSDEEVIAALLNIADSRFQEQLLGEARRAGKIAADYRIPEGHRRNLPERLDEVLAAYRARGFFSDYPFGTDLSAEEIALARALRYLEERTASRAARLRTMLDALLHGAPGTAQRAALARMGLAQPRGMSERLQQRLVALALARSA